MRSVLARVVVAVGAAVVVAAGGGRVPAADEKPAVKFEGTWKYQSYRPDPASLAADPTHPKFVTWSPAGKGVLTVHEGGTTGVLEFTGTGLKLDLKIKVTPGSPATLEIAATKKLGPDKAFTNELQGRFVPAKLGEKVGDGNPLVVRGSIIQTSADIAPKDPQPVYTTGYFVLEPLKR